MRYRLRRHDGAFQRVRDLIVPLRNRSGSFNGRAGSCVGINGRVTEGCAGCVDSRAVPEGYEGTLQPGSGEFIGSLAGGMAHDFTEILTIVMGAGTLLRARVRGDHELEQTIEQILVCSERAALLAECLREISRNGFGCGSPHNHSGASPDSVERSSQHGVAGYSREASLDVPTAALPSESALVLLVENDPQIRNGVRALLECAGYSVLAPAIADEAVVQFTRCRSSIELVILGQVLPDHGREFYHQFQSLVPDVKILFFRGDEGNLTSQVSGYFTAFMGPLESLTFLDRVRKMIAA